MRSIGPEAEIIHQRYARALIAVAEEENILDKVEDDFSFFARLFKNNKDVEMFLVHPEISREDKHFFLSRITQKAKMPDPFVDFLKFLIDKRRICLIHGIFLKYRDIYDGLRRQQKVFVRSSIELTTLVRDRLKRCLEKGIGKKVFFEETIDKSLVGGIRVQISDKIYDFSIKTSLKKLQNKLLA